MNIWSREKARRILAASGEGEEKIGQWLALQERSRFAERYFRMPDGSPWRVRDYQRASLDSHATRKVHCDGRW